MTATPDCAGNQYNSTNKQKADYTNSVQEADNDNAILTPESQAPPSPKRRKTVSSLRPVKQATSATPAPDREDGSSSVRQVHTETRFPQRKKRAKEGPVLEPTSTDRLISGIWRQLFSPVQLTRLPSVCLYVLIMSYWLMHFR